MPYLSSQHSGIGRSLITIGLYFHATGYSSNSFPKTLTLLLAPF